MLKVKSLFQEKVDKKGNSTLENFFAETKDSEASANFPFLFNHSHWKPTEKNYGKSSTLTNLGFKNSLQMKDSVLQSNLYCDPKISERRTIKFS